MLLIYENYHTGLIELYSNACVGNRVDKIPKHEVEK